MQVVFSPVAVAPAVAPDTAKSALPSLWSVGRMEWEGVLERFCIADLCKSGPVMHTEPMQTATVNPLDLDIHDGTNFAPRHEVRDQAHLEQITASMITSGWTGAPIVADVETAQAITGSHRIVAAKAAGIDVPAVDVFDLAEACGIDLYDLIETYGALEDALPRLCALASAEIREAYGLDID